MTGIADIERTRKRFSHVQGADCVTAALRNLLAWRGYELSEPMVFGLGAGLSFWYCCIAECPFPAILGTNLALEHDFCRRAGIGFTVREPSSPSEVEEPLNLVRLGEPVIVKADPYYLEYCWDGLDPAERRHFGEHVTLVVEIRGSNALLSDIWRDHLVPVSLGELQAARSSSEGYSFLRARNRWYRFDFPEKTIDWKSLIVPAAQCAAERMLSAAGNFGICGLRGAGEAMSAWLDGAADSALLEGLPLIAQRMDEGASGSCFRALFAQFLDEGATALGNSDLRINSMGWRERVAPRWAELIGRIRDVSGDPAAARREGREFARLFSMIAAEEERLCSALTKPIAG